jgi:hypothetical protein
MSEGKIPDGPREFTLEEVNRLVPELHRLVSRQLVVQDRVQGLLQQLHGRLGRLPRDIVPRGDDDEDVHALKEEISHLLRQIEEGWAEIQGLGCQIKDPQSGLVDFHGRVDGELVFFCWKFGEESVSHYHGLDEGFAGRRALPGVARHRLFN